MREVAERGGFIDFYPESFLSPDEDAEIDKVWRKHPIWIAKLSESSKGVGIKVISSSNSMRPVEKEDCIVQRYIERPLLINGGHKFDVRLYALVTSMAPLRIYLSDYGLVRLATNKYNSDLSDLSAQLTNVSINRENTNFSVKQQKLPIQELYEILEKKGVDIDKIKKEFMRVAASVLVAGASKIRPYHQSLIKHRQTSFELYGLDVLLDENLHCWLLEVNISPSMSGKDSEFDKNQKYTIMAEMYNIGRVIDCDPCSDSPCKAIELYDEEWRNSIINIDRTKQTPWDWKDPIFADMVNVRDFIEEKERLKKFRRIFPKRKTIDYFDKFMGNMGYLNKSFIEWIKMSNEERVKAFQRGEAIYAHTLNNICSKLS